MKKLLKALTDRFIRGFTGLLMLGTGLEVLDRISSQTKSWSWPNIQEALEEIWEKERDAILFIAILGGIANIGTELAHCISHKLYRKIRRRA